MFREFKKSSTGSSTTKDIRDCLTFSVKSDPSVPVFKGVGRA